MVLAAMYQPWRALSKANRLSKVIVNGLPWIGRYGWPFSGLQDGPRNDDTSEAEQRTSSKES
jgi:hypothetical protein